MPDQDGRVPLHMACDSSCRLFEDEFEGQQKNKPCYGVIKVLLSASPSTAVLEDTDGVCPIEYALLSNAEMETLSLIQRAARKVLRRNASRERDRCKQASIAQQNDSTSNTPVDVFSPRTLMGALPT